MAEFHTLLITMKGTRNLTLIIIGALVLILGVWGCNGYNGLVKQDEKVKNIFSIDTLTNIGFYTGILTALSFIALSLLFIFFFSNPKIKEQFK